MATTKNTKDKGKDKTPPDPNALRVEVHPGDSPSEKLAALATDGALTAITLQAYAGGGKELGVTELLTAMRKAGDETVAGDMGRFERVLDPPVSDLGRTVQQPGATLRAAGLIQGYRGADAAGTQGAVPGAGNGGDPGTDEEPHALHSASQHCQRPPAGQQRHSRERGEKSKSTKRTIGAPAWQHPGHWSDGNGRPS